jgi:hypothetical protein
MKIQKRQNEETVDTLVRDRISNMKRQERHYEETGGRHYEQVGEAECRGRRGTVL